MTYNQFLADDYVEPKNSDYVKLEEGTIKLRFLESPLLVETMREDYIDEKGHDKRLCTRAKLAHPKDLRRGWKLCRVCVVYNYDDNRIQLWEISQGSIRSTLANMNRDKDFGNPLAYDIKVTREGTTVNNTKYSIQGLSKTDLDPEISERHLKMPIDLDRYIELGENPFNPEKSTVKQEPIKDDLPF